jgi:DNA-binding NarL/FixJ family response regulator
VPTITLVLVDDHKIIRDGLRVLLERDQRASIVGEAADGRRGVELVLALKPRVAVIDMAMPEMNGVSAALALRNAGYGGGIVMLSSHDERRIVASALEAGVDAFVHKDVAFEELSEAILAAACREPYISPRLRSGDGEGGLERVDQLLTPREREVVQMLAEGYSVKEIGFRLALSPKTIESHRTNLMGKLGVDNLADLTRIAVREGLAKM